jgi:hypothetical protein
MDHHYSTGRRCRPVNVKGLLTRVAPLVLFAAFQPICLGAEEASAFRTVPVTDASELERLGFPPDARHVWTLVADDDAEPPAGDHPGDRWTAGMQGAAVAAFSTVSGSDFLPLSSDLEFIKGSAPSMLNGALASLTAGEAAFESQIRMPGGLALAQWELWGVHDSPDTVLEISFLSRCLSGTISINPVETPLMVLSVPPDIGPFYAELPFLPEKVETAIDPFNCAYYARVDFTAQAGAPGDLVQLLKARMTYAVPASPTLFQDRFQMP